MKIRERYQINKNAKVGESLTCPSCNESFEKIYYQQKFCKKQSGTSCKDKYWNTVTPTKRNNTTRISPASRRWMSQKVEWDEDSDNWEHPFSSEALGQY